MVLLKEDTQAVSELAGVENQITRQMIERHGASLLVQNFLFGLLVAFFFDVRKKGAWKSFGFEERFNRSGVAKAL